jgi:hypothetical protein
LEKLVWLRQMSNAVVDAAIEVPGRAFFFLVAQEKKKLRKDTLMMQYQCGQVLYQLKGYNRCRLFTITDQPDTKIIPQIDTALSWQGLHHAFLRPGSSYAQSNNGLTWFEYVG